MQILIGLDFAHSRGIIHRDIKPGNVLINHKLKEVRIADWGLADYYLPKKKFNCRVASRYFKGPELLVGMTHYDYQLDVWSTGCMLAGMMFQREPFFKGADNYDQLIKIAKVVGTTDVLDYVDKFNLKLAPQIDDKLQNFKKKPWDKFVSTQNQYLMQSTDTMESLFDLLTRMLTVDHTMRITAREAILHPFFDEVREQVYEEHVPEEFRTIAPVEQQ